MKRTLLILVMALMLTGCSTKEVEGMGNQQSSKQSAIEYVEDVKLRLKDQVSEDYFESDEWKAFVDAFWKGYNEGQSKMRKPEYMESKDVVY